MYKRYCINDQVRGTRKGNDFTGVLSTVEGGREGRGARGEGRGVGYILSRSCPGEEKGVIGYPNQVTLPPVLPLPRSGLWGEENGSGGSGTLTK